MHLKDTEGFRTRIENGDTDSRCTLPDVSMLAYLSWMVQSVCACLSMWGDQAPRGDAPCSGGIDVH